MPTVVTPFGWKTEPKQPSPVCCGKTTADSLILLLCILETVFLFNFLIVGLIILKQGPEKYEDRQREGGEHNFYAKLVLLLSVFPNCQLYLCII